MRQDDGHTLTTLKLDVGGAYRVKVLTQLDTTVLRVKMAGENAHTLKLRGGKFSIPTTFVCTFNNIYY